jgi:hypothetical protein
MFMHKFGSRGDNPPSYASFIAIVGMLALAPACLNPDISDEPPLSEEVIALELSDAGTPAAEPSMAEPSVPDESAAPTPSPPRTRRSTGPEMTRRGR